MSEFVKEWIMEKISKSPKKFGGFSSNPLIMLEFLKEFYPDATVAELTPQHMSKLSTISRTKNKLLKKNPNLDRRKYPQTSFPMLSNELE